MLKKMLRIVVTILGAIIGYGVFQLIGYWLIKSGVDINGTFTQGQQIGIGIVLQLSLELYFSD